MKKVVKIILLSLAGVMATAVAGVAGFIIYASATTLKVKDVEAMQVDGAVTKNIDKASDIDLLTWNIGYASLDERQDFYMDGGQGVIGESKETTINNMNAMTQKIKDIDPDIFLIQEADIHSKRSHFVNDVEILKENFKADQVSQNDYYRMDLGVGTKPFELESVDETKLIQSSEALSVNPKACKVLLTFLLKNLYLSN